MGADPGMLSLVMKFVADAQQFIAESKKAEAAGVETSAKITAAVEQQKIATDKLADATEAMNREAERGEVERVKQIEWYQQWIVTADRDIQRTEALKQKKLEEAEATRIQTEAVKAQKEAQAVLDHEYMIGKAQVEAYADRTRLAQAATEEFSVRGVFPLLTNLRTLARVATGILAIGIIIEEWDRFTDALQKASFAMGGFGEAAQKGLEDNIKFSDKMLESASNVAEAYRHLQETETNLAALENQRNALLSKEGPLWVANLERVLSAYNTTIGLYEYLAHARPMNQVTDAIDKQQHLLGKQHETAEKLTTAQLKYNLAVLKAKDAEEEVGLTRSAALNNRLVELQAEHEIEQREDSTHLDAMAAHNAIYASNRIKLFKEISDAQGEEQEKLDKKDTAGEKKSESAWEHETEQMYAFYAKRRKEAEADEKYWLEAGARAKKGMQENVPGIPTDLGVGGAIADAKFKLADTYKDMLEAQRHFQSEMAAEGDRARLYELSTGEKYLRHQIEMHGKTAVFYRKEAKQLLAFEQEKLQIHEHAEERRITEDAIREQKKIQNDADKTKSIPGLQDDDRAVLQKRADELIAQSRQQAAAKIRQIQKEEGDGEKELGKIYRQAAIDKAMADAASIESGAARLLGITGHKKAEAYLNMVMATAEGFVKLADKDYVGAALDFMGAAEYGIIAGQTHGKGSGGGGGGASTESASRARGSNQPGVVMGQSGGAGSGGGSHGYSTTTINVTGGMISADTMQQFAAKFGVGQTGGLYRINANSTSSLPASRA